MIREYYFNDADFQFAGTYNASQNKLFEAEMDWNRACQKLK